MPRMCKSRRAMLPFQSGLFAGRAVATLPTSRETTISSPRFQVILRRRLRLQLPPVGCRRCDGQHCHSRLDRFGDHWASCNRSGRLRRRAGPLEVAIRRVLREAGGRVVPNLRLRDAGIQGIGRYDDRAVEAVAFDLPIFNGLPLFVDATIVSPLHASGRPWRGASRINGVALERAVRSKRRTYPESFENPGARFVVFGIEVGGRWNPAAIGLLRALAKARAERDPRLLRRSAEMAWFHLWSGMLAVAAPIRTGSILGRNACTTARRRQWFNSNAE